MRWESLAVLLGFWEALSDPGPGMPVGNVSVGGLALCCARAGVGVWDKQQQKIHLRVSVQVHFHGNKGEGKKLKLRMCISN